MLLSRHPKSDLLLGGENSYESLEMRKFSVVPLNAEYMDQVSGDCILEDVDYMF
ncbi:hypothetical protein BG005_009036 [Podila minutissima]|nr:hypothetical protein BG005_009036 [Podila minutissima]